jgi:hypothetical protein
MGRPAMSAKAAPRKTCPYCMEGWKSDMCPPPPSESETVLRLREALESIVSRFECEDGGGLLTRPGLAWAMYSDAKAALAESVYSRAPVILKWCGKCCSVTRHIRVKRTLIGDFVELCDVEID